LEREWNFTGCEITEILLLDTVYEDAVLNRIKPYV
jgi:hypothetical protein